MKQYLRQILIFVMVFAIAVNPLQYSAKALELPPLKDGTYEVGLLWDVVDFEVIIEGGESVAGHLDILNGGFKYKDDHRNTKENYDQAVTNMQDELGSTAINNSGSLIVNIPFSYIQSAYQYGMHYVGFDNDYGRPLFVNATNSSFKGQVRFLQNRVNVVFEETENAKASGSPGHVWYEINAPIWGVYKLLNIKTIPTGKQIDKDGKESNLNYYDYPYLIGNDSLKSYTKDEKISIRIPLHYYSDPRALALTMQYPLSLEYEVVPIQSIIQGTTDKLQENKDTRVGVLPLNLGYINGSGEQMVADNIQIVNEAEKSIYNPITGDTTTYGDWVYDYANRSYNVTTSTGDAMTVTYGDEYVTITEGETVYNINYITYVTPEPSEPDTSEPDGNGGNNGNGNGNNNNDNDDSDSLFDVLGELLGSIIKAVSDLITPVIEALVNAIVSIIGKVLEGLGAFVDMLLRFFLEIPKMFSGFTEFLTAVFPFMPQEFVNLIIFGLMLVIIAAVVKRLLG